LVRCQLKTAGKKDSTADDTKLTAFSEYEAKTASNAVRGNLLVKVNVLAAPVTQQVHEEEIVASVKNWKTNKIINMMPVTLEVTQNSNGSFTTVVQTVNITELIL
jgi:hypothetical protein